jgi:hypothetical protein
MMRIPRGFLPRSVPINVDSRALCRAKRPATRDGFERQIARLAAGGVDRVRAAQEKRDRRARKRAQVEASHDAAAPALP